jgi:hypothetical protein
MVCVPRTSLSPASQKLVEDDAFFERREGVLVDACKRCSPSQRGLLKRPQPGSGALTLLRSTVHTQDVGESDL